MVHDAVVIGAGPAGSHISRLLALQGFNVVLFEEHSGAGEPVHCTGILAEEACDEFDIAPGAVLNSLSAVRFHSPDGGTISYNGGNFSALVIDRSRFDRTLLARAEEAGVGVVRGRRVTAVDVRPDVVRVTDASGQSTWSRAYVLACGASYGFQRQLGMGMPSIFLQSAQLEVPVEHHHDVEVFFGRDVAPAGFAWVVPVDRPTGRHARVGVMCDGDAPHYFHRLVAKVGDRWGIRTVTGKDAGFAPRLKLLPLAPVPRTYADRGIAVGDAAGLVKATTGGGIYYSLLSAQVGADVIGRRLADDRLTADALGEYETGWKDRLGSELDAQLMLRRAAARLIDSDINRVFRLVGRDSVMALIRRTAKFNQHRDVISSLMSHTPLRHVLGTPPHEAKHGLTP